MKLIALLALAAPLSAQQLQKILLPGGESGDHFGHGVAADGPYAVVGARDWDHGAKDSHGGAWLFDAQTGAQLHALLPADGEQGDQFGGACDLDGNLIVVGAHDHSASGAWGNGACYVFDASNGNELAKCVANDGTNNDSMGFSVAISGNRVLAGAYRDTPNGNGSGSAYVFDALTGQQIQKLVPDDGAAWDLFGFAVALEGNLALVGATEDDVAGVFSGSVYVFHATTGAQLAKLTPSDHGQYDRFGFSIATHGSLAVIGAQGEGGAYLFDLNTFQEVRKVVPADGPTGKSFGHAVDLNDSVVVVGASLDDTAATDAGALYVFDTQTGAQLAHRVPADGGSNQKFGWNVGLSGEVVWVGAVDDDDNGVLSGSVYRFGTEAQMGTSFCGPATTNSSGGSGRLEATGSPITFLNDVRLDATQLAANQWAVFLNSQTTGSANPPGSQGTLCLGGGIGRYASSPVHTGAAGVASLQLDLTQTPTPNGKVTIQPGETWHFQCWFRDMNPGSTSNFTEGLSIAFQ